MYHSSFKYYLGIILKSEDYLVYVRVCMCVYMLEHECLYIYTWIIIINSYECHDE